MKKLVSQKQTRCVSSVEATKRKEIKMRSAVKKVIFTFSLFGSIAAQAISVGKVDFEKKSVTGIEVELASSESNNVSVCGAHVGGLWSLTRSDITGIQVGGLMTSADNLYGAQIGLNWAGAGDIFLMDKDIVESNTVFGVQIGGFGCAAVGMSGVQIGGFWGSCCLEEMNGVQIGGFCCAGEKIRGVQITGVLSAASVLSGLQIGAVNCIEKDFSGVQIGVFNYAGEESDNCLQIGVVNWLSANETMKIVPFVNFRF